jgi:hypothetical protein
MAFQLVYTSAAKLLDAGRSGYGTVARSKSITPLVVSAIERVSQFANLRGLDRNRVIHVHRRITAGSNRFHILTRIVDAGADYTGRTNHLAHHLVISQEEAARAAARGITPADVLRQFPWLDRWDGAARFFDANEDVPLDHFRPDGRNSGSQSWAALTGNPAHARLLSWEAAPRTGVLVVPVAVDTLHLLAEALAEFGPQSWSRSFTTSLETTDELSELEWVISTPLAFPEIQSRCGSRTLYDLAHPQTLPTPPAPVMAAASPATARQDYPGAQEAESSVSSARQTGTNPVMVKIAPSGARAGGASLRRSNPKQDKKTQIKLRVGFAALLLVAGIFVIAILKGDGTDEKDPKSATTGGESQVKIDPLKEIAVTELKKINISAENASSIVSLGSDWNEWKTLIIESDKFIKEVSGSEKTTDPNLDFLDLPKLNDQSKPPQWATDLHTLIQNLKTLAGNKEETPWSKPFDQVCANIDTLKKDGSMPTFAGDNEKLKKALFRMFAEPRLQEAINQPSGQDSTPKVEALLSTIQNHKMFFEAADFNKMKESLDKKLNESQAYNKLKNVQESYPAPSSSVSLDALLSKVPDKQIIIISRDELKEGVPVKMLEAAIKASPSGGKEKHLNIDDIKIEFSPPAESDGATTKLMLSDDKKFYCWTLNDGLGAPKYYTEGRLASERGDLTSVKFHSPSAKKEAWIVVDKESDKCIHENLEYKIDLVGNSGQLSGSLVHWIKAIKHSEDRLELLANGSADVWTNVTISGATTESLPKLPDPSPSEKIFPFLKTKGITGTDGINQTDLRQDLKVLKDAVQQLNNTKALKKTSKKDDIEQCLEKIETYYKNFVSSLQGATGRTFASRILKSNEMNFDIFQISEAHRKTILSELKKIDSDLDIKKLEEKSREWEDDSNKPDKDIKKNGVTARSAEFFGLLGGNILELAEKFDLKEFSPKYLTPELDKKGAIKEEANAVNSFEALLNRAEKSTVPIELQRQEYLKKITALTVRTKKGRALFKAEASKE